MLKLGEHIIKTFNDAEKCRTKDQSTVNITFICQVGHPRGEATPFVPSFSRGFSRPNIEYCEIKFKKLTFVFYWPFTPVRSNSQLQLHKDMFKKWNKAI